jgi:hypothetical protein
MRRVVRRMTTRGSRRSDGAMPLMRAAKRPRLTCPECGAPLGVELDLFAALDPRANSPSIRANSIVSFSITTKGLEERSAIIRVVLKRSEVDTLAVCPSLENGRAEAAAAPLWPQARCRGQLRVSRGPCARVLQARSSVDSRADPRPGRHWPPRYPGAKAASVVHRLRSTLPSRSPAR